MLISILNIEKKGPHSQDVDKKIAKATKVLRQHGHDIVSAVSVFESLKDLEAVINFVKEKKDAVLVTGNTEAFICAIKDKFVVDEGVSVFELEDCVFILGDDLTKEFILLSVIPRLNYKMEKSKKFFSSQIFRTFGVSVEKIKELIKEQLEDKTKIEFFFEDLGYTEIELTVRFSNKIHIAIIQDCITKVSEKLRDYTYSYTDENIETALVNFLKENKRTIRIAESFTGGQVSAKIVSVAGASSVLEEGIVAYSNEAKTRRLGVDSKIILEYGACSMETLYEMAANIFTKGKCDFVVATVGNAGPSADPPGIAGKFYIAVGDINSIDIYDGFLSGTREEVIEYGTKMALFELYKKVQKEIIDSYL